jgi:hypothetical protein
MERRSFKIHLPEISLLSAPIWRFATNRPRPNAGDQDRAIRVFRVRVCRFLLRFLLDLPPPRSAGLRRGSGHDAGCPHFENQTCNGFEIARECLTTKSRRLQRNRAAAREGIDPPPVAALAMRGLNQRPTHVEISPIGGTIPVREVCDEFQQRCTEVFVVSARFAARYRVKAL